MWHTMGKKKKGLRAMRLDEWLGSDNVTIITEWRSE